MNKLNIVMKQTSDLIPYDNNPRINDDAVDMVANSIQSYGFKVPIIITKDNIIVAGHTRLKASIKLNIKEVPCIIADDLTDDQIKAFRLADNKVSEIAQWDFEKLEIELKDIKMDMTQFGFGDLEKQMDREVLEDSFDENEPLPINPYTKKGDIYILGKHRLMCGDSTNKEDVAKLMDGKVADMIFTDPPYNIDYEGSDGQKIQNDKMSDDDFHSFLISAFNNMFENIKQGGSIYCFHADSEGLNFRSAFKKAGFKLSSCIVWVKNAFTFGRLNYKYQHEPCLFGWKEGAPHYFIDDQTQSSVWEFNKPRVNDLHPTMKPLELVGKAIKNSSKKDEIILDLFGGSGSTMIASDQINRRAYLMELDEKYADVIVRRYLKFNQGDNDCFLIRDDKKIPLNEITDFKIEGILE